MANSTCTAGTPADAATEGGEQQCAQPLVHCVKEALPKVEVQGDAGDRRHSEQATVAGVS
jgi:hypothetical protein